MTLSSIERAYYTAKKNRALGFIKRLTARHAMAVACHERDIRECDEMLKNIPALIPLFEADAESAD